MTRGSTSWAVTAGWVLLGVLVLAPVAPVHHLAGRAIASLEADDRRIRARDAEEAWLDALAAAVDDAGVVWLPLNDPQAVAVATTPDASYLVAPALLEATALVDQDVVGALELVGRGFGSADWHTAAAARLVASELLVTLGRRDAAAQVCDLRAILTESPDDASTLARTLTLRAASLRPDPNALAALSSWVDEVHGRATDVEELVLLSRLARSNPDASGVRERVVDRRTWPALAEDARRVADAAVGTGTGRWLATGRHGFVTVDRERSRFRRGPPPDLPQVARLLAVDVASSEPDECVVSGICRGDGLTVDLGGRRVALALNPSGLFDGFDPRRWLNAALTVYAILAVLLLIAIRRQVRRAENLAAARDDLIAQVAHELRTPLTVLRMYGESLLSRRVAESSRDAYLRTIATEAERLGRLVDRVTRVARDGAPDATTPKRVDVTREAETVVAGLSELAAQRDGELRFAADAGEVVVDADPEDLRLILDVLIDNALRYGGSRPEVMIETAIDGDHARVTVSDRGPGVAAGERERIFERFTRGAAGVAASGRGAGMGLYLARSIARAAGGDLTVGERDGGGASFQLTWPLATDASLRSETPS